MKVLRLARIAAEAEALRLRRISRQTAFRIAYVAIACVFLFAAMAMGHVAGWVALARNFGPVAAAGIVAGADLAVMAIFLFAGLRSGPDKIAAEALMIRQTATKQMAQSLTLLMLLRPVTRRMQAGGLLSRVVGSAVDGFLRR